MRSAGHGWLFYCRWRAANGHFPSISRSPLSYIYFFPQHFGASGWHYWRRLQMLKWCRICPCLSCGAGHVLRCCPTGSALPPSGGHSLWGDLWGKSHFRAFMWHCCSRLGQVSVTVSSRVAVRQRAAQALDVAAHSPANTAGCSDQALRLLWSQQPAAGTGGIYFSLYFRILKQNQQSQKDGFFSRLKGAGFCGSEMLGPS